MKRIALWRKSNITKKAFSSIYSTDTFNQIIDNEMHRSLIADNTFSCVVFDMDGLSDDHIKNFLGDLQKTVRTIDQIGWMDTKKVGVLLPYTNEEGAALFTEKIRPDEFDLTESTHSFPHNWYAETSEAPHQLTRPA